MTSPETLRCRRLVSGGIRVLLVAFTVLSGAGRGEAQTVALTFTASGSAYGAQVKVTSPGAPVSDTVADVGGPTVKAELDGVGGSRAYSSFPFPGEFVATLPGLVRGLGNVAVPDYPFYAASYHPAAPTQEFSGGGIVLRAESSENRSAAVASVAGFAQDPEGTDGIGVSRSITSITSGSDGVVVEAESVTAGVHFDQLKLGSVVSVVRTTLSPDGLRRSVASLRITGVELGGHAVTTSQEGVMIGDDAVPGTEPGPLVAALAGAGFELRITPASKTATGIDAPALSVSRVMDSGETFTVNLGAASAGIDSPGAVDDEAGSPATAGALPTPPVPSPDARGEAPSEPGDLPSFVPTPAPAAATTALTDSSARPWPALAVPAPAAADLPPSGTGGDPVEVAPPSRSPAKSSAAHAGVNNPLLAKMFVRSSSGSPLLGIAIIGAALAVGIAAASSRKARSVW